MNDHAFAAFFSKTVYLLNFHIICLYRISRNIGKNLRLTLLNLILKGNRIAFTGKGRGIRGTINAYFRIFFNIPQYLVHLNDAVQFPWFSFLSFHDLRQMGRCDMPLF